MLEILESLSKALVSFTIAVLFALIMLLIGSVILAIAPFIIFGQSFYRNRFIWESV